MKFWALALSAGLSTAAALDNGTFTSRDSIHLTKVVGIGWNSGVKVGDSVSLYSPGGQYVVVRTQQGDIERDENVDRLLLWKTAAVEGALAVESPTSLPVPRLLTEQRFHDDWMAMSHIQWINDRELGFIARGAGDRMQAFRIDAASGAVTQLTHSPTDVVSFAISAGRVVYFARRATPPASTVVSLGDRSIGELLTLPRDSSGNPLELSVSSLSQDSPFLIAVPASFVTDDRIWPSPAGDYAIMLTPAVNAPFHWGDYRVWDSEHRGWTKEWVNSDPTAAALYDRLRYQLVDLKTGSVRPLFDAPDGSLSFAATPHAVFWLEGGHRATSHIPTCR